MKRTVLFFFMVLLVVAIKAQQPTPPSASDILNKAYQQAAKENKNVFLMFHASWCGWCHKMDKSMNDTSCKKFFDDNYVICHLVTDESKDKKNLENPGAAEMKIKYNGEGLGIPFWLVFDKDGNLLSDSKIRPGERRKCWLSCYRKGSRLFCGGVEENIPVKCRSA